MLGKSGSVPLPINNGIIKYMTNIHIFQLAGLVLFATGVGMLTNPGFVKNILRDLEQSAMDMFLGGITSLAIGYYLVSFHNVWGWHPALIITLLGWSALAKGLMLLMFPTFTMRLYKGVDKKGTAVGYAVVALGSILLYLGYFAY